MGESGLLLAGLIVIGVGLAGVLLWAFREASKEMARYDRLISRDSSIKRSFRKENDDSSVF